MATRITFTTAELEELFEAHVFIAELGELAGATKGRFAHNLLTLRLKDGLKFSRNYQPGAGHGQARMGFRQVELNRMRAVLFAIVAAAQRGDLSEQAMTRVPALEAIEQKIAKAAQKSRAFTLGFRLASFWMRRPA